MARSIEDKTCTVVLHDDNTSTEDVICGTDLLPTGYIGQLCAPSAGPLCIAKSSEKSRVGEVSVHVTLAHLFRFDNRMRASLSLLDNADSATATHVEILLRDQHLSRADMWRIRHQLDGCVLYRTQKLNFLGPNAASVEAVYIAGREVHSALVSHPRTKLIFRSASARFTILIQLSSEMVDKWRGTDLMYERVVDGFLTELFLRWDQLKARHQVSIVLFGRRRRTQKQTGASTESLPSDFYHVLALEVSNSSWKTLRRQLKTTLHKLAFPPTLSIAAEGNLLEALYSAALDLANNNDDQHMLITGSSIIAVTAGGGLFNADYDKLRSFTNLLVGSNTGVDIVSVAPKPLHAAPLFQYELDGRPEWGLPHWCDISFWSPEDDSEDEGPLWNFPRPKAQPDCIKIRWLQKGNALTSLSTDTFDAFDDATFAHHAAASIKLDDKEHKAEPTVKPLNDNTSSSIIPDIEHQKDQEIKTVKKSASLRHPLLQSNRKISVGPRGLAPSIGVASTGVSAEIAQQNKDQIASSYFTGGEAKTGLSNYMKGSLRKKPSHQSIISNPTSETHSVTQPLDIEAPHRVSTESSRDPASLVEEAMLEPIAQSADDYGSSHNIDAAKESENILPPKMDTGRDPMDTVTPWLTLTNPCNPRRDNMRLAGEYRQWQNIFPRIVSADEFKWDSITDPAALPLLREWRPTQNDLETLFNKKVRRLVATVSAEQQMAERAMMQMIHMRLNAGFQVVSLHKQPSEHSDRILLALGEHYQEICHLSESEIQVTEYEKRARSKSEIEDGAPASNSSFEYTTEIQATLARQRRTFNVNLRKHHMAIDWQSLDDLCMNGMSLAELGACRIRLVLIPVETLHNERQGLVRAKELSDEEHRLEGIQKLTQMWQRNRYFSDEEQRHQASMVKTKGSGAVDRDPNPLAIEYQTRDTSAVVGAFGSNFAKAGEGEHLTKLFSESEQYHTSNFDVTKLVKQMQQPPPEGVEFKDRRWFTRLHYKCFRGDEMTNWLLRVFKDLQTREDAVSLGNQLMDRDIFTHVRGKHEFRDGNYFYQIRAAHRTTEYPDTGGFFGRPTGRSIPSTPMSDFKASPAARPIQVDTDSPGNSTPTPTLAPVGSSQKKDVLLSQKLQYNVDTTRRSNQPEVVNVHYDRIHNPENCYHILIDWTSTTTKLIRESVMRWAALVESHGLRLVQLPVLEACSLGSQHPFEQAIYIGLTARPPSTVAATPKLETQTSSPRTTEVAEGYHKAILRKLDFILDTESAHSFPRNVEVSYTWAHPNYAHTQFIHKSGLMLAQIVNNGKKDFLLLPNRLGCSVMTATAKRIELPTLESILDKVVAFCHNEDALTELYEELSKPRLPGVSPFVGAAPLPSDLDVPPLDLPPRLAHRSLLRNAGGV